VRVERVVVRVPNWLGDVVLSLPALRDVRRAFPDAKLTVLARRVVAPLYEAVPGVDVLLESKGVARDAAALRGHYDLAVVFPNSFGTAFAAWRAGVPERWGYAADGRAPLLTRAPRIPEATRGRSQVYYYRAMLEAVGLSTEGPADAGLECPFGWLELGASRLVGDGPFVGINPGAAFGTAKRWLPERYAAVADVLARKTGGQVVVLGSASERPVGEAIAAAMRAPVTVLCGETSLPELLGILARLDLLLTNDSGPMHLASALGTRVVAVYGSTDWRETAPAAGGARLLRESVECAPCMLRDCPIDHRCMRRVSVESVASAALEVLLPHSGSFPSATSGAVN